MNLESIPVVRAAAIVRGDRTTFSTLWNEVDVEAPFEVVSQIVELCDGSRQLLEVVELLSQEWERNSIEGLLEDLVHKRVIVDARSLEHEFMAVAKNPMRFPMSVTEKQVQQLVSDATTRHRSDLADNAYKPSDNSLARIIAARKSVRSFTGQPVSFNTIVDMLWSAYGEYSTSDGLSHRSVPSAGALYPLIFHVCLLIETGGMQPGVYRVLFDEKGQVGFSLTSHDVLRFARSLLNPVEIQTGAHGVIVISGSFEVSNQKYGNRSQLYVPLEAGHSAQNILLTATQSKVATLEIGGFINDLLARAVMLPDGYHPLTLVAFGNEGGGSKASVSPVEVDWAVPMTSNYHPDFAIASARLSKERSWSHGRDASPELALQKAISETKEWTSCGCIPELTYASYAELKRPVKPQEILQFHPEQYKQKDFPFVQFDGSQKYGWTKAYDSNGAEYDVLADHVYFPYYPETPYYCYANSSGCAAHPNQQTAIETGTLELIERDAFMIAYLSRLDLPLVSQATLPDDVRNRAKKLEAVGFRVEFVDHSLDLAPVVFVMAQNAELNFTTCASCSSFDIEHAVSHALMEVEASVLYRLQSGTPASIEPAGVIWPNDHGRLYGQEQYFNNAQFMLAGSRSIAFGDIGKGVSRTWPELLDNFRGRGWNHLVVPLELSEEYGGNGNLSIVRVLVPGTVQMTFGYKQEPVGMRRLYEVAEMFNGKKMSYYDYTKFPHPFE